MKNLKIPELVHKELKRYVADSTANMSDIGGYAIMRYLKAQGHKFIQPISKTLRQKNKK